MQSTIYLKQMGMIDNILFVLSQVVFWKKYRFFTDLNLAEKTWRVFKAFLFHVNAYVGYHTY